MRVIIYTRVSTREQAENGYSITEQEERLRAYCKAKDWIVVKVLSDPGFSGAKMERPALQQLIRDVQHKNCDIVLVWKLDRLSRSQKDTLFLIEDVFVKNNVSFVSTNESFDTSTAFGRAMIGILSAFAQLEREQIKERSLLGREARAKDGLWHGGGFEPIGYDYDPQRGLIINDYEAMQIREIYRLFLDERWPINRIQRTMAQKYHLLRYSQHWTNTSVRSVLKTPLYMGLVTFQGKTYPGSHEPIISPERFQAAQQRLKEVAWHPDEQNRQKSPFQATQILGGITYCGNCGARYFAKGNYSGHGANKKYRPYYTCYSRAKTAKSMIRDPGCKNKSWPVVELDAAIIAEIKALIFDKERFDAISSGVASNENPTDTRSILQTQLESVEEQIGRLLDLCQRGNMPMDAIVSRLTNLQQQRNNLAERITEIEVVPPALSPAQAWAILQNASEILDGNDKDEKRKLIHTLIDRIDIIDEGFNIRWTFSPR